MTRIILLVSLALVVGLGVSCKKTDTPPQPKVEKPAAPATPAAATPAPKQDVKPAPVMAAPKAEAPKPPAPAPAPAPAPQPAAAPAGSAKMVPINIELPKPMFVGTPQDLKVANLEKPLGKPRPPFLAPEGTVNLAKDKTIKASDEMPIIGEISYITDGDKEAADGSYVELAPLVQHITVDLGKTGELYAIVLWHYHKQPRVYMDVVVQLSNDPDFIKDVKTIFNNDDDNSAGMGVGTDRPYVETNEGKLIDLLSQGSPKGRYVRFYSNGNTSNDLNHYIEVEVYGKPVE
ncbi:MAG: discoidin domain-containing protein [Planctomycetes bacterium]|jgi:hypothetical protein|nr:discoidin domain-containing protein [Planctomycetota bacterium]